MPRKSTKQPTAHPAGSTVERKKGEDRQKVAAYLEPELAARLRTYCFHNATKISDVITKALDKYLPD